jgi:hypothetical protein
MYPPKGEVLGAMEVVLRDVTLAVREQIWLDLPVFWRGT